jgi:hypothetical protein
MLGWLCLSCRCCCGAAVVVAATQGTDFMLQLADWLKEWAAGKVTGDARFKHVTFIVSDASEPGEGEHKVRCCLSQRPACQTGCMSAGCLSAGCLSSGCQ